MSEFSQRLPQPGESDPLESENPAVRMAARNEAERCQMVTSLQLAVEKACENVRTSGTTPHVPKRTPDGFTTNPIEHVLEYGKLIDEIDVIFSKSDNNPSVCTRRRERAMECLDDLVRRLCLLLSYINHSPKRDSVVIARDVTPLARLLLLRHGAILDAWYFGEGSQPENCMIRGKQWGIVVVVMCSIIDLPRSVLKDYPFLDTIRDGLDRLNDAVGPLPWHSFSEAVINCGVMREGKGVYIATKQYNDIYYRKGYEDFLLNVNTVMDLVRDRDGGGDADMERSSSFAIDIWKSLLREWADKGNELVSFPFELSKTSDGSVLQGNGKLGRQVELMRSMAMSESGTNVLVMHMAPHPILVSAYRRIFLDADPVQYDALLRSLSWRTQSMRTIPSQLTMDVYIHHAAVQLHRLVEYMERVNQVDQVDPLVVAAEDWCAWMARAGYLDADDTPRKWNYPSEHGTVAVEFMIPKGLRTKALEILRNSSRDAIRRTLEGIPFRRQRGYFTIVST